jgi:hypothetical protein
MLWLRSPATQKDNPLRLLPLGKGSSSRNFSLVTVRQNDICTQCSAQKNSGGIVVSERRSAKRWHTVLAARITPNSRSKSIECIVRDLSDTGARVYFANTSEMPSEFELEIPSRGLKAQSCLMWSRGANHGIMFLEEVKAWTDPIRSAAA